MSKISKKDNITLNLLRDFLSARNNVDYVFCNESIYEDSFNMAIHYKSGAVLDMRFIDALNLATEYIVR